MATPDVRVRLSAEGVAEVVSALKKVQAEAAKTSGKQAAGFQGLNKVLGSTANLLGGLGLALGAASFQRWLKSSVDAADRMLELSQAVGTSTENISALNLIGRTAGVGLDQLGQALARQNRALAEAAEGSTAAVATLRKLGLTVESFRGKDSVEAFETLAKSITALPSPMQRTQAAMEIFGRSGANLLPTVRQLADEGLGRVIERAEELGVLIDTDLAAAADQLNDDFELLKAQSEGLGVRLAAGLVPHVSQALQIVSGNLSQTAQAWQAFGDGIGRVVKFIVAVVSTGFDLVGTVLATVMIRFDSFIRAISRAARGDFKGSLDALKLGWTTTFKELGESIERAKARFALAFSSPDAPTGDAATDPAGLTPEETAELASKRARVQQAALDRELALAKAAAAARTAAEKRAYEQGLVDVRAYYAKRRRIIEEQAEKEIQTLRDKRALEASEVDPEKRAAEEAKIDDDLAKLRIEREEQLAALTAEERDAVRDLARDRLQLERSLLEAQGQRHQAALLGIEEELAKTDLLLRKQGASDDDREATLARQRQALEAAATWEDTLQQAEGAMADLDAQRSVIQDRVAFGMISQLEGEQHLLALEWERLVVLQQLAAALEAAAEATGDPAKIAQAQEYAAAVRQLDGAIQSSSFSLDQLRSTAIDSGRDALAEFFDTGISGAKSFKSAMRDMVLSVIADLRRMAAQALATAAMRALLLSGFSGGGQVGGGGAEKKATGGVLGGIGTGTSDSNLAYFSRGEFLVRAAVVREPGVLMHLNSLNRYGSRSLRRRPLPRFAEGGLVGGDVSSSSAPLDGRLVVGLEDGLILRHLETTAGQRVLVKAIARNRRAVRSALGT